MNKKFLEILIWLLLVAFATSVNAATNDYRKSVVSLKFITAIGFHDFTPSGAFVSSTVDQLREKYLSTGFHLSLIHNLYRGLGFRQGLGFNARFYQNIYNDKLVANSLELPLQFSYSFFENYSVFIGAMGNYQFFTDSRIPGSTDWNTLAAVASVEYKREITQTVLCSIELEYLHFFFQSPDAFLRREIRLNPGVLWSF